MLLPLFHLSVASFYVYSLWYDQQYLNYPLPVKGYTTMPLKGHLIFLTIWIFILQTLFFISSLLNDLIGSNEAFPKKRPLIRLLKDALFSLAFPMAVFVSLSFWSIYHFDRELIFPEAISVHFPPWLNHTVHSFIVFFIVLELLFTNKTYTSRKVGLVFAFTYFVSYIIWMHILFERTGAWPYPIFSVLNLPARLVFFSVCIAGVLYLYVVGEKLNTFVSMSSKKKLT